MTIGSLQAGTKGNVIPDDAVLKINVRSFDDGVRARVLDAIKRIVTAEATASGAPQPPSFTSFDHFDLTVNDPATANHVGEAFRAHFGADRVTQLTDPLPVSEDFGLFGQEWKVPSLFWYVGGTDPGVYAGQRRPAGLPRTSPPTTVPSSRPSCTRLSKPAFRPLPRPLSATSVSSERGAAILHSLALAIACLVTYWLTVHGLARIHSVSAADDVLGGVWAVIATVFVYRTSYDGSATAALGRMAATLLSFFLCLIYLLVLPVDPVGLAAMIGVSGLVATLLGRPQDAVTASITTAIVLGVASLSPHNVWQQPILRLVDTALGTAVGLGTAWILLRLTTGKAGPA